MLDTREDSVTNNKFKTLVFFKIPLKVVQFNEVISPLVSAF